jgi:tetratricopeptide (TPR) repeat protein
MSTPAENKEREDPVKMHKEANQLFDSGKHKEAREIFIKTAELYHKVQNYFDSSTMLYKAGEAAFAIKDYESAVESFLKSAELSFQKGFDRFGVSALEYAKDAYSALGKHEKVKELEKKIKEMKKKLEESF